MVVWGQPLPLRRAGPLHFRVQVPDYTEGFEGGRAELPSEETREGAAVTQKLLGLGSEGWRGVR